MKCKGTPGFCGDPEESSFMKPPESGRNSIQACFMRLMHRYTSANYKRFLGIGIHPGQLAFVKAIREHEGISQRELAEGLHVKAPTVAVAVKRLEKAEIICRRPDPKDQRISRLYLSEKGKSIAEEVTHMIEENEEVLTQGFSKEELEQLRGFFRRMSENMDRFADPAEEVQGEKPRLGEQKQKELREAAETQKEGITAKSGFNK